MKFEVNVKNPKRLAVLLVLLSCAIAGAVTVPGRIVVDSLFGTTFQAVTDGVQTFSNDKTLLGSLTLNQQTSADTALVINGDAGIGGNVTMGSLVSNSHTMNGSLCVQGAVDCLSDVNGVLTSDSGIAVVTGTVETNLVPTLTFMDRAAPTQTFAMECGADAGSTGALSVTLHFANVGGTLPVCFCNDINAAQKACNPSAAPTATGVAFIGEGGGSDVISFCCIGPK